MFTAGSAFPPSPVLRAGLGGLPQAALFGHGTAALACQRDGTSKGGGDLFGGITSLKTGTWGFSSNVTVACSKKGPSDMGQEVQGSYSSTTAKFFSEPQTENDKYIILEKVAGLTEKSINLLLKAEAELKTDEGSSLYKLWWIGMGFLGTRDGCRKGREPMGLVPIVARDLEMLRRIVYSATNAPLPPTAAEFVLLAYAGNSNDDTVSKLERLFDAVKADLAELLAI